MTNSSNEDKKSYMCGGREGTAVGEAEGGRVRGYVGARVACSLRNFYATRESNFHQFHVGGSNVGLEILQLSSGECTVPSPVARSYYHPETSI